MGRTPGEKESDSLTCRYTDQVSREARMMSEAWGVGRAEGHSGLGRVSSQGSEACDGSRSLGGGDVGYAGLGARECQPCSPLPRRCWGYSPQSGVHAPTLLSRLCCLAQAGLVLPAGVSALPAFVTSPPASNTLLSLTCDWQLSRMPVVPALLWAV